MVTGFRPSGRLVVVLLRRFLLLPVLVQIWSSSLAWTVSFTLLTPGFGLTPGFFLGFLLTPRLLLGLLVDAWLLLGLLVDAWLLLGLLVTDAWLLLGLLVDAWLLRFRLDSFYSLLQNF